MKNRLSVTFKVNDLFDTGKFIINTENEVRNGEDEIIYNQLMYAERQRQKRNTSIVLNYNFGKQQRKSGAEEVSLAVLVEWVEVEWIWTIDLGRLIR